MRMQDWISKLDEFLKVSDKELLTHAGSISAEAAAQKAENEFEKYRIERSKKMISDFDLAIKELEKKSNKEM